MSAHPDAKRSQLRTLVAAVQATIGEDDASPLQAAWRALVTNLDLGPEPAVRTCPRCGSTGMKAASRCGYCWVELTTAA